MLPFYAIRYFQHFTPFSISHDSFSSLIRILCNKVQIFYDAKIMELNLQLFGHATNILSHI